MKVNKRQRMSPGMCFLTPPVPFRALFSLVPGTLDLMRATSPGPVCLQRTTKVKLVVGKGGMDRSTKRLQPACLQPLPQKIVVLNPSSARKGTPTSQEKQDACNGLPHF